MASETVTTTPIICSPNPTVKLPPAALRLETLDFDPTGNPYYKFPPFLPPPTGVKLIPFEDFKPHGIQITLEGSDVEELDGEGIPTVELGAKHVAPAEKEKKKKKKRSKKEGDKPKNSPWWDDWGEGEDLRRADSYDPNTPRRDRFAQGATEFMQNRKWSPALQSLYDHFRHYAGLLVHNTKNRFGKGGDGAEADDEEDDDEAELTAEEQKAKEEADANPFPKPIVDVDTDDEPKLREVDPDVQQRYEEEQEDKEMRMDAFLNDPEQSIKIFFSSYYKDKGLFWSEPKLRDGPILLSFFLAFFIRNRIMPDYEKQLRKAHTVAERARLELPQTTRISIAMPDDFARGATALWGPRQPQSWAGTGGVAIDVDDERPDPPPALAQIVKPLTEWEEQLKERGVEKIEVDMDVVTPPEPIDEPNGWGTRMDVPSTGETVGGWGDGATVIRDASNPWAPNTEPEDWGSGDDAPSLMSVLGPTTIPLTHALQLAEKSTRQIVSVSPPSPEGAGLERVLGSVVLAPWTSVRDRPGSTIVPCEMLGERPEGSTFDPDKDSIRVLVDPKTVEVLREGMGLHAVYVEAVAVEGTDAAPKDKKKSKSRGKGKGKAKGADDREWWYIEFVYEVLPSFWTDEGTL